MAAPPGPPKAPAVSVIVCTYNRLELLKQCLAAVRRQTRPGFEIIVVNGACSDGTKDYLAAQPGLHVLNQPENVGLSAARNVGIREARGEILVFIDDDCLPDADWLEKLLAPYADPGIAGVGGQVIGLPGREFSFDHGGVNRFGIVQTLRAGAGFHPYLVGCNMSFRRSALDAVGRFDEAFFLCYDETDLCLRLQREGYQLAFNDEAPILHHIHVEGKRDLHRFYWKARSRRRLMLKNFNDEIGGWPGFLAFEAFNLGRNLYRFVLGLVGGRQPVLAAEFLPTLRGALDGYLACPVPVRQAGPGGRQRPAKGF